MDNHQAQKILLQTMQDVFNANIKTLNTTNSTIGVVTQAPKGYDVTVEIDGNEYECILTENLHSWIQKDDIVIVQDLYNDGRTRVVTGKTGARGRDASLVFNDENSNKLVSGVDGVFEDGELLDVHLSVKGE